MRRVVWSLSLSFAGALSAWGQDAPPAPAAATLGTPRASLGAPRPAAGPSYIVPTQHREVSRSIPGLDPVPGVPERLSDGPKPMPNTGGPANGADGRPTLPAPANGPVVSGPALPAAVVGAEEPLFGLPENAPPFIDRGRFRLSAEYLMWWTKGFSVPPLVTTGPAGSDGIVGEPGVSVLFGNTTVGPNFRNGARFGFNWSFGPRQVWGLDGRYFFLAKEGQTAAFSSDATPLIARPFFNLNEGVNFSEIVASPGTFGGGIVINSTSSFWGADLNLRRRLFDGCAWSIDGLVGYRYQQLGETLTITESSTDLSPPVVTFPLLSVLGGTSFDRFRTVNHFNGGQIGAAFERTVGRFVFDVRTSVAFGVTSSTVDVSGGQTANFNFGAVETQAGLLALDSNTGRTTRNHFAVVPEVTFNIGYNITPRLRVFAGYNLVYWSSVLRPGDQIDTGLDVNRIPNFGRSPNTLTQTRPTVTLRDTDFLAQGINFGLMFRW